MQSQQTKLLSMLGICRKAGQLLLGSDVVLEAIQKKQIYLILFTADISPRSARRIESAAGQPCVAMIHTSLTMDDIFAQTGRTSGILGITDQGLADAVKRIIGRMNEEDTVC